jgi:hypothetical protein
MDIFRLSGKKYPIYILAPTFSTVSLEFDNQVGLHSSLCLGLPNPSGMPNVGFTCGAALTLTPIWPSIFV